MNIDKLILCVTAIVVGIIVITAAIIFVTKFVKMNKEDRIQVLKEYIKEIIETMGEQLLENETIEDKIQIIENYFHEKAPATYRIILFLLGKENLKEIIQSALDEVHDWSLDKK